MMNCLCLLDVQNEKQLLLRFFCYSWLVCLLGFFTLLDAFFVLGLVEIKRTFFIFSVSFSGKDKDSCTLPGVAVVSRWKTTSSQTLEKRLKKYINGIYFSKPDKMVIWRFHF